MERQVTAQELYNTFYSEACTRARIKGEPKPNEVEVFRILVKMARQAVLDEECPPDFLHELAEVKPQIALEREAALREEHRERGLREGLFSDINDIYAELGLTPPDDSSSPEKK